MDTDLARIHNEIEAVSNRLVSLTQEYRSVANQAAEDEADYQHRYNTAIVRLKGSAEKMTDKEAEARAKVSAAEEFRAHKISAAALDSMKQALATYRARLDALRTEAATHRSMATLT